MSDKQTLSQKLAALAANGETFANGARIVSDGTTPPVLEAVLQEIDNTVLTRQLTFRAGATEITLVAGSRRLRGLIKASADIKGVLGVLGKVAKADDADLNAALTDIMTQFANTTGQVTVQSTEPSALADQTDAGIPAPVLAEMWGVELNAAPPTPMQAYVRSLAPAASAWILIDADGVSTTGGDGADLSALKRALDKQGVSFFESVNSMTNSVGLVCLNGALGGARSVAVAKTEDETVLICYDAENVGEMHSKWSH